MSAILLDKKPKTTLKHTSYDSSYIRGHVRTVMAENISGALTQGGSRRMAGASCFCQ